MMICPQLVSWKVYSVNPMAKLSNFIQPQMLEDGESFCSLNNRRLYVFKWAKVLPLPSFRVFFMTKPCPGKRIFREWCHKSTL